MYELTTWNGDYLIEKFDTLEGAVKEGKKLMDGGWFVTLAVFQGETRLARIPDESGE